ncbi:hypothetical protein [Microbispora corallina]|nr:hypothetical protein [Microbispora corallina]
MRRAMILAVASLFVPVAACGTGDPPHAPPGAGAAGNSGGESPGSGASGAGGVSPGAGTSATGTVQVMPVMREISRCFRSHGVPGFPDPIVDNRSGYPIFPPNAPRVPQAARAACEPIARRLPPGAMATHPPTPEYMRGLIAYAGCMRAHGLPDWPDPDPDGEFPLPPRLLAAGKRGFVAQMRSCAAVNPDPSKRVSIRGAAS